MTRNSIRSTGNNTPRFPTPFKSNQVLQTTLRYTSKALAPLTVTRKTILDSLLIAGYNNGGALNQMTRLCTSVRLKKIRAWSIQDSYYSTLTLGWLGGQYGRETEVSATGNNIEPARITTKPPKMSSAAMWSTTGFNETEQLFVLTAINTDGVVIDLDLECVFDSNGTPPFYAASPIGSSVIVGNLYIVCLDGIGSAGNWLAQGYISAK
jgi:hypothetical protein